jgi:hypothetical protein
MRGISDAEGDETLKGLEAKTPGRQSGSKPKGRKMTSIRIQSAQNGGFISHPDFEQPKAKKSEIAPYEETKPNAHADLQSVHDYLDQNWGQ